MAEMRRFWVGGNWKCNGDRATLTTLVNQFNAFDFNMLKTEVVIFPSLLHVDTGLNTLDKNKYEVGVQNFSQEKCGAFTGEVAIPMLKDAGINWSLIGHSERRSMFGETDETVANKVDMAQKANLKTAVCIGENLQEREAGKVDEVITRQLKAFIERVTDWSLVVIAYEPVWAIGTGKVAMPEQVREVHQLVRDLLKEAIGPVAEEVRIVYGGSVNEKNCTELMSVKNVDGFLVGGKSLTPEFCDIIASTLA